jgi:hypothetical protein
MEMAKKEINVTYRGRPVRLVEVQGTVTQVDKQQRMQVSGGSGSVYSSNWTDTTVFLTDGEGAQHAINLPYCDPLIAVGQTACVVSVPTSQGAELPLYIINSTTTQWWWVNGSVRPIGKALGRAISTWMVFLPTELAAICVLVLGCFILRALGALCLFLPIMLSFGSWMVYITAEPVASQLSWWRCSRCGVELVAALKAAKST